MNLPENYGALIVPSCGFAQVVHRSKFQKLWAPLIEPVKINLSLRFQVFPEHKYLIVETLRQVFNQTSSVLLLCYFKQRFAKSRSLFAEKIA
jgi:hypothetical protein